MSGSLDIILMASGFSRRFGPENKLLALFRGKTLISRALDLAVSLPPEGEVILVCAETLVAEAAAGLPVHVIHNYHPERGLSESVRMGVTASVAEHYLFMPCDQPLLDAETVAAVTAERSPGRIVVPCHAGVPGSPVLFASSYREELLHLPPGSAPRNIKERHAGNVISVEIPSVFPLRDVDTPLELALLEQEADEAGILGERE